MELAHITAVILAGGLGTRLRAVVSDCPKVLARINGRPFITYLLDYLAAAGLRRVVLCTGYLGEQVSAELGEEYQGLSLGYSREEIPLGTGGALKLACPMFGSDPVLVMNGDSYCAADLDLFLRQHKAAGATASMLLTEVPEVDRYGSVLVDKLGRVERFEEKGGNTGPGLINAGTYLLSTEIVASIPRDSAVSLERDVFPQLIGKGLYGFPGSGRFIDIGIPADYEAATGFFSPSDSVIMKEERI